MDQSLDSIIAARPKGIRRGSRRGGAASGARAQILGNGAGAATNARARYAGATPAANGKASSQPAANKIIVSNLPQDVNEAQIRELFTATVGPLRDVTLHFDSQGRSKGAASVNFSRQGDGTKAYEQYNNRLIDGS